MIFNLIYEQDYSRLIRAIEIDARTDNPAIKNQIGSVIKAYNDSILGTINSNSLVYKVETDSGNLAGYFVLQVDPSNQTVVLSRLVTRPAFNVSVTQISSQIKQFITNGGWKQDFLF